jgi:cytochrome oxidase assembly protein ShyY1
MRISFHFRAIPFAATLLLVALGVSLGQWQERRAAQKIAMQSLMVARQNAAPLRVGAEPLLPDAVEYRRVTVTGQFVPGWPVYLDNRPYQGRAGFYLLMPLRVAGSDMHVLVARGWLARDSVERARLPHYPTPSGEVTVEGVATMRMGHVMQLGTAAPVAPNAILQNIEPAQLALAAGIKLQPFFIEQAGKGDLADPLVRDWPAPSLGVEKHQGYAFQWYALAVMAFLFFVITGFRRGTTKTE